MNKTNLQVSGSKTPLRIIFALVAIVTLMISAGGSPALAQKPQATLPAGFATVTDQWAVQVAPGTDADALAAQLGAVNLGQVGTLTGYYVFRKPGTDSNATAMADAFAASSQVLWYEQQVARQLSSRAFTPPTDPLYASQWHLVNANVPAAWSAGYTGSGVTIGIVDDGLQYTHPDLSAPKYVAPASWDFNGPSGSINYPGDNDPYPVKLTGTLQDRHGTAVAGVAAAGANNSYCGVGVAYDANLAGLRLISEPVTDAQEAAALTYHSNLPDMISIYNNSWGPADDGRTLRAPDTLTLAALENGVTNGRAGKGSIYVWAAGNGLQFLDNVNYDGYANSRFGIAVGAVDSTGIQTAYGEPGAAMFVTAPSSPNTAGGIITTDLMGTSGYNTGTSPTGDCTNIGFGGTSSSAPVVSGVVALMLQANPNLGWRDVQHILALTAVQNDSAGTWTFNGAGFHINHKYGFGLVDAEAAVTMAKTWVNVDPEISVTSGVIPVGQSIPDLEPTIGVTSTVDIIDDLQLEHVEVVFNATHPYRGDLKVVLTAPSGIKSVLADRRDDPNPNYSSWRFMTVRDWGESSKGIWSLQVTDLRGADVGTFDNWELILYGTTMTTKNISGSVGPGVDGVFLKIINGTTGTTNYIYPPDATTGNYTFEVPNSWAGQVIPVLACNTFTPASMTYGHMSGNQINQDYTSTPTVDPTCAMRTISGVVTSALGEPIEGALVKTDLGYKAITAVDGSYMLSGLLPETTVTVMASMSGFTTGSQDVTLLADPLDLTGVDFALVPSSTSISVTIGGGLKGNYSMLPGQSMVMKYVLDGGPVEISSNNGTKIVASLNQWRRPLAYGGWTGVAQSMALPVGLISNKYVMPRYNGADDTLYDAVLMSNVDTVPRDITVTIGGTQMGTYTLGPSDSVYKVYYGVVGGPIVVSSDIGSKIVASLYELKRGVPGVGWNGQSEMMGLPTTLLSDKYLIPIYFGNWGTYLDASLVVGIP